MELRSAVFERSRRHVIVLQVQLVELCFIRELVLDLPVQQLLASLSIDLLFFCLIFDLGWLLLLRERPLTRDF